MSRRTLKTKLARFWETLHTSFWFVPGALVILHGTFAAVLLAIDHHWGPTLAEQLPSIGPTTPPAARSFLSTVAAGLLGITGVTFSITIVTLTLASSQFGPRLVRNFIRSTPTQVVLGGLLGTVIFALIILASVNEHGPAPEIPRVSVLAAFALTLFSLSLFVFFLHHIAISIQADRVVTTVFAETQALLDRLFPGQDEPTDADVEDEPDLSSASDPTPVCSDTDGYLQVIDSSLLLESARDQNLVVTVVHKPGDFLLRESPLAMVRGLDGEPPAESLLEKLQPAFLLGPSRTASQDAEFTINQLVELALRALSPGINDPFTAIACIDYLGAILHRIARCGIPDHRIRDDKGTIRVILQEIKFDGLLGAAVDQIRQQADAHPSVLLRLLEMLTALLDRCETEPFRAAVIAQARMVADRAGQTLAAERDIESLKERIAKLDRVEGKAEA